MRNRWELSRRRKLRWRKSPTDVIDPQMSPIDLVTISSIIPTPLQPTPNRHLRDRFRRDGLGRGSIRHFLL